MGMPRTSSSRARCFVLLLLLLIASTVAGPVACNGSGDPAPGLPGADPNSSADQLSSRLRPTQQRDPGLGLVAAVQPPPAKPFMSLGTARARLAEPGNAPVVAALTAAGLDADEIAVLVTGAAAHNSNTVADPVVARLTESGKRFDREMKELDQGIGDAERATGAVVDRKRLFDRMFGLNAGAYGAASTVVR